MKRIGLYVQKAFVLILVSFLISCISVREEESREADLVILNGNIYTVDEKNTRVEAVAVVQDRIADVGTTEGIKTWIGPSTEILDLDGKTMTPGLIESHGHLLGLGQRELSVDVSSVRQYRELVARVAEAVRKARPGEWIVGGGWHQSKWESPPEPNVRGFPTHQALSRVSPDNPVILFHASGHAALVNAKAMEISGITDATVFGEGGEILKDENGKPTGILIEAAQSVVARYMPQPGPEQARRMLEVGLKACLENGITTFHEAAADRSTIDLYKWFLEQGKLAVRLYVMVSPRSPEDSQLIMEWLDRGPEIGLGGGFLTIRSIKLFADGALGSRGAWLLEPYSDDPGNSGHALIPGAAIFEISRNALKSGFQVATHAIGDRANREVLDQYERAFLENPQASKDHRFRIEHAQHIGGKDIPRFARLGVIASMQGIHMSSDISWAIDRLGPERIAEGAYVWQKLIQAGTVVTNGTDTPVEPIDPITNFYASVTRRTRDGILYDWSHPEQSMSRDQALRSYTINGAYAAFEEKIKGSIELGKLADFTVFSQDLMKVEAERIRETEIVYTIVGGKIIYRN
ncbi:MAG TPA: amidohydrolase [Spirochaetia bacterium]|nr:amidohydrolase [Spirochaetia bacterium]